MTKGYKKERHYTWADGKELSLEKKTLVMGILNGTPDSFSDGGSYTTVKEAIGQVKRMEEEGAAIIDVGFESTRPGHVQISVEEELARMTDLLPSILEETSLPVSIDTYRSETAEKALSMGAHIVNDIWGLQYDPALAKVVKKYNVPIILMHNQDHEEYGDIIEDMKAFFEKSISIAKEAGIEDDYIWLDPGIGFGKNVAQNIEVMERLEELTSLPYPILLGTSRKRMIGALLGDLPPKERDEGTAATSVIGAMRGVDVVRVHNVKQSYRALQVANGIK